MGSATWGVGRGVCHAVPLAELSIGEVCRHPQWPRLQVSAGAARAPGLVSGKGCWGHPDLVFCHEKILG